MAYIRRDEKNIRSFADENGVNRNRANNMPTNAQGILIGLTLAQRRFIATT